MQRMHVIDHAITLPPYCSTQQRPTLARDKRVNRNTDRDITIAQLMQDRKSDRLEIQYDLIFSLHER
jgi:hypothetical protein